MSKVITTLLSAKNGVIVTSGRQTIQFQNPFLRICFLVPLLIFLFFVGSVRSRCQDKNSCACGLFGNSGNIGRGLGKLRQRREGSQKSVYNQTSYHCGQLDLNPLGKLSGWCKHMPQRYLTRGNIPTSFHHWFRISEARAS